jgi:hypothetical protein
VIWDIRGKAAADPEPNMQFAEIKFYTDNDALIPIASCAAVKSRVDTCRNFSRSHLLNPLSEPFI